MISEISLLNQRFENHRPGLTLVAIEEAAIPVTIVDTDVLAQERKPLALLDEFVLRLTSAGISKKSEIASFLGLDAVMVDNTIADQVNSANLTYRASSSSVQLTSQGERSVQDLELVQPVRKEIPVVFDRLTWSVTDYTRSRLLNKSEAREAGMIILPPCQTSRISTADITAPVLNSLLGAHSKASKATEILTVRKVRPYTHRYYAARLLIYADLERDEVQVGVVIDGDLSQAHELALAELGGPGALGIHVDVAGERPLLEDGLEQLRVAEDEVAELRSTTIDRRVEAASGDAVSISDSSPTSSEERSLDEILVRSVSVFEHRELLNEALDSSHSRLLLISPWVRSAVVDNNFIARLERRIRAGVVVDIAHGFGKDDRGSDAAALERLGKLSQRFQKSFTLTRLENSHAKVLIFDGKWVSTSFNWLSFQGNPDRTYRMEEGTLVQIPAQVSAEYDRYVNLIAEHRAATK